MNRIISAAFCLLALCGAAEAEKVKITGGGETFRAEIERTALSSQLLESLPAEIEMRHLFPYQISGGRKIKAEGDFRRGLKKGDLAYCEYGYFIIFIENQPEGDRNGFVRIGRIEPDDVEKLGTVSGGGRIRIEQAD